MGNTLMSLLVKLGLDTTEFDKGTDRAKEKAAGLQGGLAAIGGGIVAGGLMAAATGAAALTGGLIYSIKAAADAEEIQAQLNAVLKSTGGAAGVTAQAANDLATSLSTVTPFEDDAIVGGENMLLTFTNIGKDTFPMATEAMLNLSQSMGQDLQSSAVQLGKALNDPTQGMTALQRVGVTFSDDQKKLIERLQKTGDMAGAQKVILSELSKEFGGSAKAAGETFAGQMTIVQNQLGNVAETIGGAVLPIITNLAGELSNELNDPEVLAFVQNLAMQVAGFAASAVANIPVAIQWFQNAFAWLQENQGVVVAVMAVMGAAVAAFVYTTVIPAAIAMLITLAPIIAVIVLIGVAVYLLYQAWTTNFGGIRDTLTAIWYGTLLPALTQLWNWLQVNIPVALTWLSNTWTTVLLPAIMNVWSWMSTVLFPFLQIVASFFTAVFNVVVAAAGAIWRNVLLPAFQSVGNYLGPILQPLFKSLSDFMSGPFLVAVKDIVTWVGSKLTAAFGWLNDVLKNAAGFMSNLADALNGLPSSLPSWVTGSGSGGGSGKVPNGGSGGPGGANGLDMIVPRGYPNDTFNVRASSGERVWIGDADESPGGTGTHYHLNVYTTQSPDVVVRSYGMMQALAGG